MAAEEGRRSGNVRFRSVLRRALAANVRMQSRMDDLDLETIFHAEGSGTAEMEAMAIREILESNGVAVMLAGDSRFPNLPFEIKVTRDQASHARRLITEAQSAGPAAAEAGELESERDQAER